MFENKEFEGIYYSRFVASWIKSGGKVSRIDRWLDTLVVNGRYIPNDVIQEIYNFANNGKLELESHAKLYLSNEELWRKAHEGNL